MKIWAEDTPNVADLTDEQIGKGIVFGSKTISAIVNSGLKKIYKVVAENILPVGTILAYGKNDWVDNVTLKGWYECNATNASLNLTPDLTFSILTHGRTVGTAGGNNQFSITKEQMPTHNHIISHNHDLFDGSNMTNMTTEEGKHWHNIPTRDNMTVGKNAIATSYQSSNAYNNYTGDAGEHRHIVYCKKYEGNSANTGNGQAINMENILKYYKVKYIMKVM